MKHLKNFLLMLFLFTNQNVFSQIDFENGCWMPKSYIDLIEKDITNKNHESLLKPVNAILIKGQKIYIKSYKDEFYKTGYKYINPNKISLRRVMINLAVHGRIMDDPVLNKYALDQYYLYRRGKNSMFLIIKDQKKHVDTIEFTRYIINGVPIISDDIAAYQIKLAGRFDLFSSYLVKLEKNIFIKADGSFKNSKLIKAMLLKDSPNIYTGANDFYVTSVIVFNNLKSEKVILKFDSSDNILIYLNNQGHIGEELYLLKRSNPRCP